MKVDNLNFDLPIDVRLGSENVVKNIAGINGALESMRIALVTDEEKVKEDDAKLEISSQDMQRKKDELKIELLLLITPTHGKFSRYLDQ